MVFWSYFLALGANLAFSSASLVYAKYSALRSPMWMNATKASIAFAALSILIVFFPPKTLEWAAIGNFALSGFVGLNIGDLFLLRAFVQLGPGRTLMLFGFHPLILGSLSWLLFDESIASYKMISVVFFVACLFLFSLESYQKDRTWNLKGLSYAVIGVLLDASGILLTRNAFELAPEYSNVHGHFFRTMGAVAGFIVFAWIKPFNFIEGFKSLQPKGKFWVVLASLAGTFLSLLMYLGAIKYGELATVSAIAITGPLFATFLEHVVHKKRPSIYLWWSLVFFVSGFTLLLLI